MACKHCDEIRAAILHGKFATAAGLTVQAWRVKMGLVDPEPAEETDKPAKRK